jgi:hypothetical protein
VSNATIVSRLSALADDYENGRVTLAVFATELVGHAEALEGMDYRKIKEAQMVQAQLRQAIESGQEQNVDRSSLIGWLRPWIASAPVSAA